MVCGHALRPVPLPSGSVNTSVKYLVQEGYPTYCVRNGKCNKECTCAYVVDMSMQSHYIYTKFVLCSIRM